jgi:paraquat-inducible protein B
MTKPKINPAAVGVFIAGAIVILFASLVLFGSGRFFRKTKELLLTFREPVTGLEVGAPVKLMGVTIGDVKGINLAVGDDATNALLINVLIEVDLEGAESSFQSYRINLDDRSRFETLVQQRGLGGQLEVLSLLSGQLYIALDMIPGRGGFRLHREKEHGLWEIPTLPSTKRQLVNSVMTSLNNLTELDFKGLSMELKGLLTELRTDLARLNFGEINTNLVGVLDKVESFVGNPALSSAITNLDRTLAQLDELAGNLNKNINPLLANLDADLKKAGAALDEATQALSALKTQVEPNSTLIRELNRTLEKAGVTLDSIRQLADELQRNPNSLITGKPESKP